MSDPNDPKRFYPISAYSYHVLACADCGLPTIELRDADGAVITIAHIDPTTIDGLAAALHGVARSRRN